MTPKVSTAMGAKRCRASIFAEMNGGAENAGVEKAGVENAGVDSRHGKCRSDNVWKRMESRKKRKVYA